MDILYVLIISLWGLTAQGEWVYVGNQIVYQEPMTKENCEIMADSWGAHEMNEYYTFSYECKKA
jgi:roadblock/LC7 domain-containing protein